MNQLTARLSFFVLASGLILSQANAQQAPAEKTTAQIRRNSTSGNLQTATLSKNIFKSETVQVPYVERVPYQETETYTVDVPYQETETYVENVPYQIEVPYTEYVTDYRQEYRCQNVTRYRQECRNEQRCYNVPGPGPNCRMVEECGVNVHGQRICKTRQVCDGGGGPTQRCDYHQVCHQVPYTDRDCRYENVPYQREVTRYRTETRYRQETRTRTVTRYRTETRTRTVTKYRDEQRCCRQEVRQVFDRQLQFQVEVYFPVEAELTDSQTEILQVSLVNATEQTAGVQIQNSATVYNYIIESQQTSGATIRVELAIAPELKLTAQDVASLSDSKKIGAALVGAGLDSGLLIQDATADFSDVTTEYAIYLDLKTEDGNRPLNMRAFSRAQVKALGGVVRMADVIQNNNTSRTALISGNTIVFSVIAKRSGTSPLIAGKTLKAQKLASVVLK